jgi:hypothetical protein
MNYHFHDVAQNEDEWYALRVGRVGGSAIGKIMANYGKQFGDPAKDMAVRIALEQITGVRNEQTYNNSHMERGHEQEPVARMLYEDTFFCDVDNGGYYTVGDDIGVSPDGRVGDDGLIEIKSVIDTVHYATIKRNAFDPKYKWQLYYELQNTEREWVDYVSFCADFPVGKRLFVDRIYRENCGEYFEMISTRMAEFREIVSDAKLVILSR